MKQSVRGTSVVLRTNDEEPSIPVPCRACGAEVKVTSWVIQKARSFDAYLANKGEPPLSNGELTMCPPCGARWEQRRHEHAMALGERVRGLIRDVKDGREANKEQLLWLKRNGYTDTADGLEALMKARAKNNGPGRHSV